MRPLTNLNYILKFSRLSEIFIILRFYFVFDMGAEEEIKANTEDFSPRLLMC